MPGPVYQIGATAVCFHVSGQVNVIAGFPRVLLTGMPVARLTDTTLVVGCLGVTASGIPPCTTVLWQGGGTPGAAGGGPGLLQTSAGVGLNPAPGGPVSILATQPRVVAI